MASDTRGAPDFWPLFLRSAMPSELHVWVFDLLALDGKDLPNWSLERRQARLQAIVSRFACPTVVAAEAFSDGQALLEVASNGISWKAGSRSAAMQMHTNWEGEWAC